MKLLINLTTIHFGDTTIAYGCGWSCLSIKDSVICSGRGLHINRDNYKNFLNQGSKYNISSWQGVSLILAGVFLVLGIIMYLKKHRKNHRLN